MKNLFSKMTGIILSAGLLLTGYVLPAAAATDLGSYNFDGMTQENLNSRGNWIGVYNRSGSQQWQINADIKKGDSGASLYLPSDFESNTWLNRNDCDGTGLYEISYDAYINSVNADIGFDYRATDGTWIGGIKIKTGNVWWTPFGKTYPLELKKWYNLRFVIDTDRKITATFLDGELIYKNTFTQNAVERLNSKLKDAYIDNLSVKKGTETPSITMDITEKSGSIKYPDTFSNATLNAADFQLTTDVKIETSKDGVSNWSTVYETSETSGEISTAVLSQGYLRAAMYCGDTLLAASEAKKADSVSGEVLNTYFTNFNGLAVTNPAIKKADDGSINFNELNYQNMFTDREYITGTKNPYRFWCASVDSEAVGTFGTDDAGTGHGPALWITSTYGSTSQFMVLGYRPNTGNQFASTSALGMSKEEYDAADGNSYEEKMTNRYVSLSANVMFPDFNYKKYIYRMRFVGDNGASTQMVENAGLVVLAGENGEASLVFHGENRELAKVSLNKWYNIKSVYDIKNNVVYAFLDNIYVGCYDYTNSQYMPESKHVIGISDATIVLSGTKTEGAKSEICFDDFDVQTLEFSKDADVSYTIDGQSVSEITAGNLGEIITAKNDGSARTFSVISTIYENGDCKRIKSAAVSAISFDAGELLKTFNINVGNVTAENKVKTIIIDSLENVEPICAAGEL